MSTEIIAEPEIQTASAVNGNTHIYEVHGLSDSIRMHDEDEYANLKESIGKTGQRDPIIMKDGLLIDGRNRLKACVELGIEPIFEEWNEAKHGESVADYIAAKNIARRSLTASQRSAFAVDMLPYLEAEAKLRHRGPAIPDPEEGIIPEELIHVPSKSNSENVGIPALPESDSSKPETTPGKKKGKAKKPVTDNSGAATEIAAKKVGVSGTSVRNAKALKAADPLKFADVRDGKITLNRAVKETPKPKKPEVTGAVTQDEFDSAIKKIGRSCGMALSKSIAEGDRLDRRQAVALAAMSEDDQKKLKPLIEMGWTLAAAKRYEIPRAFTVRTDIGDLITAAASRGGKFGTTVNGYEITAKKQ